MHTQADARNTWCPHVRVAMYQNDSHTSVNRETCDIKCIASECSQWRWITMNQHGAGAQLGRDGELLWTEARGGKQTAVPPDTARGYCGIGGGIGR